MTSFIGIKTFTNCEMTVKVIILRAVCNAARILVIVDLRRSTPSTVTNVDIIHSEGFSRSGENVLETKSADRYYFQRNPYPE